MVRKNALLRPVAAILALVLLTALPAGALTPAQAGALLEENYVDPVPQTVLDQPTIQGMLDALGDPYTEYFTAGEYQRFLSSMADPVTGGIGVTTLAKEEGLLVTALTEDGPAYQAGIREGDYLIAVDGADIRGMDSDASAALIRGTVGTDVAITFLRGRTRTTVTITRAVISIPATRGTLVGDNVGYIQCETWGEETPGYFRAIIDELDDQVGCWLIDLRDNTGGYTAAATETAGLFCGTGAMLYLRLRSSGESDGYTYQAHTSRTPAITNKPAVILINGLSASASEAFAAAMREYDRAVTVGQRTYGKGVAQGIWDQASDPDLFPDGDAIKITIARSYSPLSNTNDLMGLIPVFPTDEEDTAGMGLFLAETIAQDPESWRDTVDEFLAEGIQSAAFADTGDSPYEPSISALAAYELVNGADDGLFHPLDTLTRAQLAQMIANLLRCPVRTGAARFTDVPAGAWYAGAVYAVSAMGMMEGTGEGLFEPERVLSHQELITVVGRVSRWLNDDMDTSIRQAAGDEWALSVLEEYAGWARPSAWLLSCSLDNGHGRLVNLLWDEPDLIDPAAPATREETADLLYSILYYLDILY